MSESDDTDWRARALDAESALQEAHLAFAALVSERDGRDRAIEALTRRVAELLPRTGCQHERTTRGANVPRRYGSWRTEVCRDCGAFRTHGHDAARSQLSDWRPASEYAEATAEQELE